MFSLLALFLVLSYGLFAMLKPLATRASSGERHLIRLLFTHPARSSMGRQPSQPLAPVRPMPATPSPQEKPQAGTKAGRNSRQARKPFWVRPPLPTDPLDMRRVAISI